MNTLHRIREFALVTVMATGALMVLAIQADGVSACERHDSSADTGHVTVAGARSTEVAELGSMTIQAKRFSYPLVTDLGAITVTASRPAELRVADLGSLTVTATRFDTILVAARPSNRSWN
jgi:hypothetical protein